jgi:hypothetical protein
MQSPGEEQEPQHQNDHPGHSGHPDDIRGSGNRPLPQFLQDDRGQKNFEEPDQNHHDSRVEIGGCHASSL